jgi:hypothetical protein
MGGARAPVTQNNHRRWVDINFLEGSGIATSLIYPQRAGQERETAYDKDAGDISRIDITDLIEKPQPGPEGSQGLRMFKGLY